MFTKPTYIYVNMHLHIIKAVHMPRIPVQHECNAHGRCSTRDEQKRVFGFSAKDSFLVILSSGNHGRLTATM
jgi:hypothetical protein